MEINEILSHVDHTLLSPTATWEEIKKLCDEAILYNTASVCIPPSFVKAVKATFPTQITICTVIGFPLGYNTASVKHAEAIQALEDGADEIDMVINLSHVKNKEFDKIEQEIITLKKECLNKTLKVIIETCYLTQEEKIALCKVVTNVGADYIKTSTGFGTGGATKDDVLLMKEHIGDAVRIKAAGGISTREDLEMFLELGCDRIGTSKAVHLLVGNEEKTGSSY